MNTPSSKAIEFSCPFCLRSIKASPKVSGKTFPCPGCGKEVNVPKLTEVMPDTAEQSESDHEYGLAAPVESQKHTPVVDPSLSDPAYLDDLDDDNYRVSKSTYRPGNSPTSKRNHDEEEDELKVAERPTLPPHPMTTGIFSMFADGSAIVWLVVLSFFHAIVIGLLTVPAMIFSGMVELVEKADMATFVVGALNTGAGTFLGMIVLLFAANCFLCILQDSAAGNRIIESWPDKAGGAFSLVGILYVLGALFYCVLIGFAATWSLRNQGIGWLPVQLGIVFLTFPLFLTSSLEAGSPMLPISLIMIRSLFARFTAWLAFYLETAVLFAIGIVVTLTLVWSIGPKAQPLSIACGLVLGPLFTFLLFVYFRLLGRLVWVCDEWVRSLEPEEEEEDAEEDKKKGNGKKEEEERDWGDLELS